ncbi:MAG: hypothetical protein EOP51_09235 [Sphingobacteriales bacterium]|nr:MAG: hypothetical protein EOP51_09235 [Sphingobacteriales bacterium]
MNKYEKVCSKGMHLMERYSIAEERWIAKSNAMKQDVIDQILETLKEFPTSGDFDEYCKHLIEFSRTSREYEGELQKEASIADTKKDIYNLGVNSLKFWCSTRSLASID